MVLEVSWLSSQRDAEPWSHTGLVDRAGPPAGELAEQGMGTMLHSPSPSPSQPPGLRKEERNKILYSYVGESFFPEILPSSKLTAHPPVKTATFNLPLLLGEMEQLGRKLPAIHFP